MSTNYLRADGLHITLVLPNFNKPVHFMCLLYEYYMIRLTFLVALETICFVSLFVVHCSGPKAELGQGFGVIYPGFFIETLSPSHLINLFYCTLKME